MSAPTEIRQRAKNLVDQLPGESLAEAVEFLEAFCREAGQRSLVATSKPEEAALLQIIQRRLSEDDQTGLAYCATRNESGDITEAEHQDLLFKPVQTDRVDTVLAADLLDAVV